MKIRNINQMKNIALAVAAFALAAPVAQAQGRVYNAVTGRYTTTNNSRISNSVNANLNNGFYGNNYLGYLNNYGPYITGSDPYANIYDQGVPYRQNGAIILGANGQLYDTTANNGNGGIVDPSEEQGNASGMINVAPTQLNDQIEAVRLSGNRVKIAWAGDPRPVASMKFSLLDRQRNEVRTTVVNDLPAQATFTRPSNAVYYRVVILYGDGATRSLVAPL